VRMGVVISFPSFDGFVWRRRAMLVHIAID